VWYNRTMKTPEQLAWIALQRSMGAGWIVQRHEDRYSSGIPDVSYVLPGGAAGWIELKAGDRFEIRPDQANWAAARAGWGARCLVMAPGAGDQWAGVRVSGANLPRLRRATRFEHLAALGRVGTGRELVLEL